MQLLCQQKDDTPSWHSREKGHQLQSQKTALLRPVSSFHGRSNCSLHSQTIWPLQDVSDSRRAPRLLGVSPTPCMSPLSKRTILPSYSKSIFPLCVLAPSENKRRSMNLTISREEIPAKQSNSHRTIKTARVGLGMELRGALLRGARTMGWVQPPACKKMSQPVIKGVQKEDSCLVGVLWG